MIWAVVVEELVAEELRNLRNLRNQGNLGNIENKLIGCRVSNLKT